MKDWLDDMCCVYEDRLLERDSVRKYVAVAMVIRCCGRRIANGRNGASCESCPEDYWKYGQRFNCNGVGMIDTSKCENSFCCCFISFVVKGNGKHKRNQNKRIRHLSIAC